MRLWKALVVGAASCLAFTALSGLAAAQPVLMGAALVTAGQGVSAGGTSDEGAGNLVGDYVAEVWDAVHSAPGLLDVDGTTEGMSVEVYMHEAPLPDAVQLIIEQAQRDGVTVHRVEVPWDWDGYRQAISEISNAVQAAGIPVTTVGGYTQMHVGVNQEVTPELQQQVRDIVEPLTTLPIVIETRGEDDTTDAPPIDDLLGGTSEPPFADVDPSNPHAANIEWLRDQRITQPADGNFRPTAPVTRQAAATFLHRLDAFMNIND